MHSHPSCTALEKVDDGILLTQLDDLCLVHFADRSVDAAQTRTVGEKLIDFIERGGCRKLVISFDGLESVYGFLLDRPSQPASGPLGHRRAGSPVQPVAGSDLWLG
jgi:hypothetical protein